ncbi:hypothetical protein UA08_07117 [Talaromyces atroroseus]|uniref:alpha-1,3-glucan synthase n=1 Tax=Talaromyces atroroseus TaxID=1441469 RepID=A0A225AEM0_TALAT|nr:hypothetical protein UA08_07117 [Talaromyces atroroseus]OKL57513.1 hypothetical protein UA08_07117 [Talaromyces atroroseus]
MEYDIEDWDIKIKIGGLGVMAQLMGANLRHQNLIWVVPCVGGIDYPLDQVAEPMRITVLDQTFLVHVQYHYFRNITYVLLDAPIFRAQTKSQPYPARMDDLDSAIYYSAWNSCIAEALQRFPVDIYHINDYQGAVAQLHLLPKTISCCLSLHNSEFQGLWPMRTFQECEEISLIFNLDPSIVKQHVQFGDVFNLLHAGATYLRIHQNGFGAVGVSRKYGKRSWARYPIFWGLKEIGSLPNPDPSDTEDWNQDIQIGEAHVDPVFEAARSDMKRQAQIWAGLEQSPDAELFVFVGRWSMQKGIDLMADVFPSVPENYPKTQLICVGPVIDLYGRFAAIKLSRTADLYPGRVFSNPQFTVLPPCIFSGADFGLIPSRDEPFGLVAVEFGRKGTLGVGSRVGGLGQMPGWWYTMRSSRSLQIPLGNILKNLRSDLFIVHLNGKNYDDQLCIERYLSKSEKEWFRKYHDLKLGRSPNRATSSVASLVLANRASFNEDTDGGSTPTVLGSPVVEATSAEVEEELKLPQDYFPPSGLKKIMLYHIGDWPIYSIFLAFGQILAANSYQITLLNGEVGEPAEKLYLIATIYLVFSVVWWIVYRSLRSIFVLSVPFLLYGIAFAFIGISPSVSGATGRLWVHNVATGLYAAASSSGSIYFALNFGDEGQLILFSQIVTRKLTSTYLLGNASIGSWVYRACVIQGTQQIYVSFLWYWGSMLAAASQAEHTRTSLANYQPRLLIIGIGLGIAAILWISPGKVPAFYKSLPRRKKVLWFFYAVFIQNYWLSAPYGRNWLYLWSSKHTHAWQITILILVFFVVIWALALWILGILSKRHAWFVPIFAIGLGAPRWCQMLWSTSNIGSYVPWAGGSVASTLLGRGLWLWLGVLDALQGVGFGMILFNTLTRFHIAFTLLAAQVIGSISTILARATAPDKIGPGDVFPDFSAGLHDALSKADFWVCLSFLLSVNVLCFFFSRKEQLQKP